MNDRQTCGGLLEAAVASRRHANVYTVTKESWSIILKPMWHGNVINETLRGSARLKKKRHSALCFGEWNTQATEVNTRRSFRLTTWLVPTYQQQTVVRQFSIYWDEHGYYSFVLFQIKKCHDFHVFRTVPRIMHHNVSMD